ncbi:hypothetical protein, partial [Tateyamaria sp.]
MANHLKPDGVADMPEETHTPDLLTPKAAVELYAAHGITRGRGLQTLARMRMGQSKVTGPEYVRMDGYIYYRHESVLLDIDRVLGLPAFTSTAQEKDAGRNVPNADRDY